MSCPHHVTYHRGSRAKAVKRLPVPPWTAQHSRPRDGWLYTLSACRAGGVEEGTDPGSGIEEGKACLHVQASLGFTTKPQHADLCRACRVGRASGTTHSKCLRTSPCDRELAEGIGEQLVAGKLSSRGPEPAGSPKLSLHTSPFYSQCVGCSQSSAFPECPLTPGRPWTCCTSHSWRPPDPPQAPQCSPASWASLTPQQGLCESLGAP